MNQIDYIYKRNIEEILNNGFSDKNQNVRPEYKDGTKAYTKFITQVVEVYNINKNEFPITNLRPTAWKSGIKEVLWIYQDQSNDLDLLKEKHNITWWDEWDIGNRTIGQRYGATINTYDLMNKLLNNLEKKPYSRRHIINMWQEKDFEKKGLKPCAFMIEVSIRDEFLDLSLTQRSNDYLMAGHINKIQYVALQMMIAKHIGLKPGKFLHKVQNLHIYDRHFDNAKKLIKRYEKNPNMKQPKLILDTDKTNFYEFSIKDFKIKDYDPLDKMKRLEIAI
ncbi:MAG: thymidylate synthase [Bacillota bacterium]